MIDYDYCEQMAMAETMPIIAKAVENVPQKAEDIIFECHGVHHLHQLQNAYCLATGEELEVQP